MFLTSQSADVESIAVTQRGPDAFTVEANGKGQVDGSFSYRIVAKRKDQVAERLKREPGPIPAADVRVTVAPLPPPPEIKPPSK